MNDFNPINGILLVNKPQGFTSNAVLQKVKRLFGVKKAGHTGSLDPIATGMLPLCLGEATKWCQYLLDADKCYQTQGLLGIKTDTADATGKIIAQSPVQVSIEQLKAVLEYFKGTIEQIPSMYSALKHQGVPLYKLAREGKMVDRAARKITISHLELTDVRQTQFSLKVVCTKGTYIRNLVEDIGEALAVGAHVLQLHRVYTAGFQDEKMYTLGELQQLSLSQLLDCLLPMDRAVHHFPMLTLRDIETKQLRQGKACILPKIDKIGTVRLYDEDKIFLGLGHLSAESVLKAQRLLSYKSACNVK